MHSKIANLNLNNDKFYFKIQFDFFQFDLEMISCMNKIQIMKSESTNLDKKINNFSTILLKLK